MFSCFLCALCDVAEVQQQFPGESVVSIQTYIRQKLYNAAKILKKQSQKTASVSV